MRPSRFILGMLALSALVVAGFLFFEYGVGLYPCELCLQERLPWYGAGLLGLALLLPPAAGLRRWAPLGFGLILLASVGLAAHHVAVEQHWIAGPIACTAPKLKAKTIEELTAQLMATPNLRCDEVQWSLLGVSLAGFNLLVSLLALGGTIWVWRSQQEQRA